MGLASRESPPSALWPGKNTVSSGWLEARVPLKPMFPVGLVPCGVGGTGVQERRAHMHCVGSSEQSTRGCRVGGEGSVCVDSHLSAEGTMGRETGHDYLAPQLATGTFKLLPRASELGRKESSMHTPSAAAIPSAWPSRSLGDGGEACCSHMLSFSLESAQTKCRGGGEVLCPWSIRVAGEGPAGQRLPRILEGCSQGPLEDEEEESPGRLGSGILRSLPVRAEMMAHPCDLPAG